MGRGGAFRYKLPARTAPADPASIPARVWADDHAIERRGDGTGEVRFDAVSWFEEASAEGIMDLAECGWGRDYPADVVADFFISTDPDIARLMTHAVGVAVGYECEVDGRAALAWLRSHRPKLYARCHKMGISTELIGPLDGAAF